MLCNNATGYLKLQVPIVNNIRNANTIEVFTCRSICLVTVMFDSFHELVAVQK